MINWCKKSGIKCNLRSHANFIMSIVCIPYHITNSQYCQFRAIPCDKFRYGLQDSAHMSLILPNVWHIQFTPRRPGYILTRVVSDLDCQHVLELRNDCPVLAHFGFILLYQINKPEYVHVGLVQYWNMFVSLDTDDSWWLKSCLREDKTFVSLAGQYHGYLWLGHADS